MWKVFLVALALLAGGCTSMPQKFDLAASKDQGALVMSVRYSADDLTNDSSTIFRGATLSLRKEDAFMHFGDVAVSSRLVRGIDIEGERFAKLNVLLLAPGTYTLWRVEVAGWVAVLKQPLSVTIRPGRATYAGMVQVHAIPGMRYRMDTFDMQERDIPLFMKHWPDVSRDAIDVQMPS